MWLLGVQMRGMSKEIMSSILQPSEGHFFFGRESKCQVEGVSLFLAGGLEIHLVLWPPTSLTLRFSTNFFRLLASPLTGFCGGHCYLQKPYQKHKTLFVQLFQDQKRVALRLHWLWQNIKPKRKQQHWTGYKRLWKEQIDGVMYHHIFLIKKTIN